jgi:oxalate decarboxylase
VSDDKLTRRDFAAAAGAAGLGVVSSFMPFVPAERPKQPMGLAERVLADPAEPIPPFTFKIEQQVGKVTAGGVGKEATVKEFPISEGLAGVSMYLKPGGLRELHWHALAAEWAFMNRGRCRVTVFDPEGHNEVVDLGPGDIWYFPRGYGHSLQGLGPDETHFVLVFDNGHFSEYGTFSVSDWMALTGSNVLSQNFSTPASTFSDIPKKEVYIAQGRVPAPLPADPPPGTQRVGSLTHKYQLTAQVPHEFPGGTIQLASSVEFPMSTTMTGAYMTLKPGALRAMHWHPNADEWQYYIAGRARVTLFGSSGRARTEDVGPGEAVYIPRGFGHHIESLGPEEARIILAFNSGIYQESNLASWLATVPPEIVTDNTGIPETTVGGFSKNTPAILAAR